MSKVITRLLEQNKTVDSFEKICRPGDVLRIGEQFFEVNMMYHDRELKMFFSPVDANGDCSGEYAGIHLRPFHGGLAVFSAKEARELIASGNFVVS